MNSKSYTAASIAVPAKLARLGSKVVNVDGRIIPLHIQVSLTNVCNLRCSFCSCANRDSSLSLPAQELCRTLDRYYSKGCRAITITGGGEPTLHPDFLLLTAHMRGLGLSLGLVTNGLTLEKTYGLEGYRWIRVSCGDDRDTQALSRALRRVAPSTPSVDWAVSYVLSRRPDWDKLISISHLARDLRFTHVRVVPDLLDLECTETLLPEAVTRLRSAGAYWPGIIVQPRQNHEQGDRFCRISLLKPQIGSDGNIYPCCGVQYARSDDIRDFDAEMRMGTIYDPELPEEPFDGSRCLKCYYGGYNRLLDAILESPDHKEFV